MFHVNNVSCLGIYHLLVAAVTLQNHIKLRPWSIHSQNSHSPDARNKKQIYFLFSLNRLSEPLFGHLGAKVVLFRRAKKKKTWRNEKDKMKLFGRDTKHQSNRKHKRKNSKSNYGFCDGDLSVVRPFWHLFLDLAIFKRFLRFVEVTRKRQICAKFWLKRRFIWKIQQNCENVSSFKRIWWTNAEIRPIFASLFQLIAFDRIK